MTKKARSSYNEGEGTSAMFASTPDRQPAHQQTPEHFAGSVPEDDWLSPRHRHSVETFGAAITKVSDELLWHLVTDGASQGLPGE